MTPKRLAKLRRVLDCRQPDLTVLLDNVHKPHNFSAVLRSCDAVGVFEANAVWPDARLRPHRVVSSGAAKWVKVRTHGDIVTAGETLRGEGFRLVAAQPGPQSRDYREVDYTHPTAVLLGAELEGLSDWALALADERVHVPMVGMVESLNVSVAAATILFEARHQRMQAGLYAASRLEPERYAQTFFEWAHPEVADYCRRHGLAYPELDEKGEIPGGALPRAD